VTRLGILVAAVAVGLFNGLLMELSTEAPGWGSFAVALLSVTIVLWSREP